MGISFNQIIFINEYPFLKGGTEYYVYQVAGELKQLGIKTILMYDGKHFPGSKMRSVFDQMFPIIDIKTQLKNYPNGIVYLNNYRDPNLIKNLLKTNLPLFRYIHDHYLTCPRSSKTDPIKSETCTKKVGLACYTCPGVISRPDGKLKLRTPSETIRELKLHNNFKNIIVSSLYLQNELTRNGLVSKRISINPIYQSGLGKKFGSFSNFQHKDQFNILYVGSLIKGKGVELLIKALEICNLPFHLNIVGDGPWRNKLEALARTSHSKSIINFIGNIDHDSLQQYYKIAKAVIVPSTLPETFSKAAADGLHFGTLPICADVGGISSWLKNYTNGVLFKGGSAKDLAEKLTQLAKGELDPVIDKIRYIPSSLPTLNDHTHRLIEIFDLELNRKIPFKKYSYAETSTFVKNMDKICDIFKEAVLKIIPPNKIDSIILIGGYGRGEGGVVGENNQVVPHNNLDFQIILNTIRVGKYSEFRKQIINEVNKNQPNKRITLDFSFNTKLKIKFGIPQLVYYDMKYGHRLIYGEDKWLLNIKKYNSQNINYHDIRELMINRGTLLILNELILQEKPLTNEMKMVLIKHAIKAVIGYGDALLYLHGKYHWSYKRKKELMWSLTPAYPSFAKIYQFAINFRFNPNYDRLLNSDMELMHRYLVRNVEKIHLLFEQKISNQPFLTWDKYFEYITKRPLYSKKGNLLNLLKLFYQNFIKSETSSCNKIPVESIFKCKLVGNRGILLALFPFILYGHKIPHDSFKQIPNLLEFYISIWGETNDENFDQTLPSRLMRKEVA